MKTIELNEQQIIMIKHFMEQALDPLEKYSQTTKMVAQQIISKLEEE